MLLARGSRSSMSGAKFVPYGVIYFHPTTSYNAGEECLKKYIRGISIEPSQKEEEEEEDQLDDGIPDGPHRVIFGVFKGCNCHDCVGKNKHEAYFRTVYQNSAEQADKEMCKQDGDGGDDDDEEEEDEVDGVDGEEEENEEDYRGCKKSGWQGGICCLQLTGDFVPRVAREAGRFKLRKLRGLKRKPCNDHCVCEEGDIACFRQYGDTIKNFSPIRQSDIGHDCPGHDCPRTDGDDGGGKRQCSKSPAENKDGAGKAQE